MKILIADHDARSLSLISAALRRGGYSVSRATTGTQAMQRWRTDRFNLLLLHANLAGLNGFEICRRIRQEADVPIIMLTAPNDDDAMLRGFQLGADECVTKPVNIKALVALIQAILRRHTGKAANRSGGRVRTGAITLDPQSHEATRDGRSLPLTPLEFRILYALATHPGRVMPYSLLVDLAWGYDGGDAELLRTHISHIRKKLGMPVGETFGITSVRDVGYRFQPAA